MITAHYYEYFQSQNSYVYILYQSSLKLLGTMDVTMN